MSANGRAKSNEMPPTIQSGFVKTRGKIATYIGCLTALYAAIYVGFLNSENVIGFPKPGEEFCQSAAGSTCSRSDLFGFQISSGLAIAYCGLVGFYCWHISKRVHTALPATPAGRLYGYLEESESLAAINFSFQFWDFWISLLIPEHRGALMLLHHTAAATLCYFSLEYQMLHYYGVFFLGCTEFSSIFLVVIDLAKYFPPETDTLFDTALAASGPLFAVTFAIYRVVLWWQVSYLLFTDCYHVVATGISNQLRPGKNYVLYVFLVLNVPLGFLQLYWFSLILKEVGKVLTG